MANCSRLPTLAAYKSAQPQTFQSFPEPEKTQQRCGACSRCHVICHIGFGAPMLGLRSIALHSGIQQSCHNPAATEGPWLTVTGARKDTLTP